MFSLYGRSNPTLKINFYDGVYMKNLNIVVFDFKSEKFQIFKMINTNFFTRVKLKN